MKYILVLAPYRYENGILYETYIFEQMKLMGQAPCEPFHDLAQALEMMNQLQKTMSYRISILTFNPELNRDGNEVAGW